MSGIPALVLSSKMAISSAQRTVILGGGFSGVMTAVNLVRLGGEAASITVVNANRPLGRGVAYGTRRGEHLLNVAARNMSAGSQIWFSSSRVRYSSNTGQMDLRWMRLRRPCRPGRGRAA